MKKKRIPNNNGISICDSIVMSVRKKRLDFRFPLALFLAVCGFTSVIMSFLGMFHLVYDKKSLALAAVGFSAFYILLTVFNRKATMWVYAGSSLIFAFAAYRKLSKIVEGFKFVYNVIYKQSYHTDVAYYDHLNPKHEKAAVTTMLIFAVWMLAIVIYYFTICRPNPILPLMITFPIIEIGLYNGIELPVFWGMLTIAYWLALFAMSTIDVGEYTSGPGGFVRKDDLFFPKRKMKLKVTERCGVFIMACVMLVSGITSVYINVSGYERSDKINEKRRDISDAFSAFTVDDIFGSLSRIAAAFGFNVDFDDQKLGRDDKIEYDGETDLIVTFSDICEGAVYLKEDNKAIYYDSEWDTLDSDAYDDERFQEAIKTMYPQDMYGVFSELIYPARDTVKITVEPQMKKKRYFTPYGTVNDSMDYIDDSMVECESKAKQEYTVHYASISEILNILLFETNGGNTVVSPEESLKGNSALVYGGFQSMLNSNHDYYDIQLAEKKYQDFVYDYYRQIPDVSSYKDVLMQYVGNYTYNTSQSTVKYNIKMLKKIKDTLAEKCRYTLEPGKTPYSEDFVSYFLMKNRKGYCVHFATAGVILARMAGVPARYAEGYVIVKDDFKNAKRNPDGSYTLEIKDNRSHAWTEVYLEGFGWVPFDFTTGYGETRIDPGNADVDKPRSSDPQTPTNSSQQTTTNVTTTLTTTNYNGGGGTVTTTTTSISGSVPSQTPSGGSGSSSSSKGIPKAVKAIILFLVVITAAIGAVLIRRNCIIKKRKNSFKNGSRSERMASIYAYSEKLLANLKTEIGDLNYNEFADEVESKLGGRYFENGDFRFIMNAALCGAFSNSGPDEETVRICGVITEKFAAKIYERSGFFYKLLLKYISVLI